MPERASNTAPQSSTPEDRNDVAGHGRSVDSSTPDEPTSWELLADYECPECGPMADLDFITEDQATAVFGGDENGVVRCPTEWCDGEELEQTAEAAAANLAWIMERMGRD